MTRAQGEWVTDYIRYHVLIRVFDGDAHTWLEVLERQARASSAEAAFVEWIQNRLTSDPDLLGALKNLVDTSGLWPAQEKHS